MATGLARKPDGSGQSDFIALPRADIRTPEEALLTVPAGYLDAMVTHRKLDSILKALASGRPKVIGNFEITEFIGLDEQNKPVHPAHTLSGIERQSAIAVNGWRSYV